MKPSVSITPDDIVNCRKVRVVYYLPAFLVLLALIFSGCASSSSQLKLSAPAITSKPTSLDFIYVTTASSLQDLDAERGLLIDSIISGLRQRLSLSDISRNQTNGSSSNGIKVLVEIKEITKVSDDARVWYGGLAGRANILVHVTVSDLKSGQQIEVFEVKGESGKSAFAGTTNEAIQRARSFQPIPVEGVPPRSPNLDYGCHSESAGVLRTIRAKVEIISQYKTSMSYIESFEKELTSKLESAEDTASIVRWISEKVLESYRNGITAGKNGAVVKRNGESRRRSSFGKAE